MTVCMGWMVLGLMEVLPLLEGAAEDAKAVWNRCVCVCDVCMRACLTATGAATLPEGVAEHTKVANNNKYGE